MSSNWEIRYISEIANFENHKRIPLSSLDRENRKGIYPYYGASGIIDYIDNYIFDGKYLLISEDGENLKSRKMPIAFKATGKFWVNNHAHILSEKEAGGLDYLMYFFSNIDLCPYLTGAVQPKLNKKTLDNIPINFPIKEIRIKINSILSVIDQKIQLNTQINQTLEAIAQAIFKSWFVNFEPVKAKAAVRAKGGNRDEAERAAMRVISGKSDSELDNMAKQSPDAYTELTHTASLFPDQLVDSELGEIPERWVVGTIGEYYSIVMGQSPKGESYNNIGEGRLFFQGRAEFGWRYPSPRLYTSDPKRMAKSGDILMSVRAPVGDLNIALDDCCIGRGLCALRHNIGNTTYSYYHLLETQKIFKNYNNEGTVFGSINQKTLKSITITEPSYELIQLFCRRITSIDRKIRMLTIQNQTLSSLRDTLLPKLLSGELDVSHLLTEEDA